MISRSLSLNTAAVRVVLSSQTLQGSVEVQQGGAFVFRSENIAVTVLATENPLVRAVTICNESSQEVQLRKISFDWPPSYFDGQLDARDYVQLYHSREFTNLSGVRPVHRPAPWSRPSDASGMVSVFSHRRTNESVLLGAVPPYGDCFVDLPILHAEPHMDGAFGFGFHLQASRSLAPQQKLILAHLVVLQGHSGIQLLEQYASILRERLGTFTPRPERVSGWNSWDYYSGAVREQDVIENAAAARAQYGNDLKYIVIDEGYESQWGVWEAGWKFSEGLASLCEQIRQLGYEPGIWTAPLMVSVYTPLFREHPDWFVGDEKGNVYTQSMGYGGMAQLDITHPDAAEHIRNTYVRLRAAGFTYFKCDFTQLLLGASTFHRNELSHAGMIRRLFEIIREAIGGENYLSACGAPYESVIGIADAHRTTGDIHNYWSHIRQNIRSMFARWWMQGAIGNTDPDFAIVRCEETTEDRLLNRRLAKNPWGAGANWMSGRETDLTEAKTLLLACYVTGGDLILGDALPKINRLGAELLSTILKNPIQRGVPVNLFTPDGDELPIVAAESEGRKLLVFFNLSDDYRTQAVPKEFRELASGAWQEFWTGEPAAPAQPEGIELKPRSAHAWWIA